MGNDPSKPSSSRMATSAIAHIMRITKSQLLELRDKCISLSEEDTEGQYQMKKSAFVFSMKDMNVADEPDYQILEKLFIMWDKDNKDSVDTLQFFAGIAPLASVLDVETKLQFALTVYDYKKTGRIDHEGVVKVLSAINTNASYLGDATISTKQIAQIVDDVFSSSIVDDNGTISYEDKIKKIANHPLICEFTSNSGQLKYGLMETGSEENGTANQVLQVCTNQVSQVCGLTSPLSCH